MLEGDQAVTGDEKTKAVADKNTITNGSSEVGAGKMSDVTFAH